VVGLGDTVSTAQEKAYQRVKQIQWNDVYYRTDIGHRAIKREQSGETHQNKQNTARWLATLVTAKFVIILVAIVIILLLKGLL
jgi:hypothetical protein